MDGIRIFQMERSSPKGSDVIYFTCINFCPATQPRSLPFIYSKVFIDDFWKLHLEVPHLPHGFCGIPSPERSNITSWSWVTGVPMSMEIRHLREASFISTNV